MKCTRLMVWTGIGIAVSMGVLLGAAHVFASKRPVDARQIISDQAVLSLFNGSRIDPKVIGPFFGKSDTLLVVAGGSCSECNKIATLGASESSGLLPVLYVFHPADSANDELIEGQPESVSVIFYDLFSLNAQMYEPFSFLVNKDGTVVAARQLILPTRDLYSTSDIIDYMVKGK